MTAFARSLPKPVWLVVLAIAFGATAPGASWAFSEDLCWAYQDPAAQSGPLDPKPFNCWDLQCKDSPNGNTPAGACVAQGALTYVDAAVLETLHARNSLHFDVVYLLARLQGMSLSDARKLAVFDAATDFGQYRHYDAGGQNVLAMSDDILGVRRTNFSTNGFWLHFVPWFRGSGSETTSTLVYTPSGGATAAFPSTERPLNHLRAWAFGAQTELCEFGLTAGSGVTGSCFGDGNAKTLYYDLPLLAGPNDIVDARQPQISPLEWQRVARSSSAGSDCTDRNACFDRSYSSKTGTLEALGIYLHSLGDRLSHHFCSDHASIGTTWQGEGTPNSSADYYLFYPDICGTMAHVLLHYPESGQEEVPERSENAIRLAMREIAEWVRVRGYSAAGPVLPRAGYPAVANLDAIVQLVSSAIAKGPAAERIGALCQIARNGYGLEWHDGSADCQYQPGDAAAAASDSPALVAEFYNTGLNHYFITASPAEKRFIASGGAGPGWQRTGERFKTGGNAPVCRFYGNQNLNPATGQAYGPNSHFYTIDPGECEAVKQDRGWVFESGEVFRLASLTAPEQCPSGTLPVYRVYNLRFAQNDSNHRYLTDAVLYQTMQVQGWRGEGTVFCTSPPSPPLS